MKITGSAVFLASIVTGFVAFAQPEQENVGQKTAKTVSQALVIDASATDAAIRTLTMQWLQAAERITWSSRFEMAFNTIAFVRKHALIARKEASGSLRILGGFEHNRGGAADFLLVPLTWETDIESAFHALGDSLMRFDAVNRILYMNERILVSDTEKGIQLMLTAYRAEDTRRVDYTSNLGCMRYRGPYYTAAFEDRLMRAYGGDDYGVIVSHIVEKLVAQINSVSEKGIRSSKGRNELSQLIDAIRAEIAETGSFNIDANDEAALDTIYGAEALSPHESRARYERLLTAAVFEILDTIPVHAEAQFRKQGYFCGSFL